jgi:hypothetical protein
MEPMIVFELCQYLEIFFLAMPICLSVKRKKSKGALSEEYRGCRGTVLSLLARNFCRDKAE